MQDEGQPFVRAERVEDDEQRETHRVRDDRGVLGTSFVLRHDELGQLIGEARLRVSSP